jgi:hypothetical protein
MISFCRFKQSMTRSIRGFPMRNDGYEFITTDSTDGLNPMEEERIRIFFFDPLSPLNQTKIRQVRIHAKSSLA